jgi:hypothetical protein
MVKRKSSGAKKQRRRTMRDDTGDFHVSERSFRQANQLADRIDHSKFDNLSLPEPLPDDEISDPGEATELDEPDSDDDLFRPPSRDPPLDNEDEDDDDDGTLDEREIQEIEEEQQADVEELEEIVLTRKDVQKKFRKAKSLPSVPELYGLDRALCGQKPSSEAGTKCMFTWHCYVCECENREPYIDFKDNDGNPKGRDQLFGLSLYRSEAFTSQFQDSKAYDAQFLGRTFAVLSTYCSPSMIKKSSYIL